jgi:hypothetical protein
MRWHRREPTTRNRFRVRATRFGACDKRNNNDRAALTTPRGVFLEKNHKCQNRYLFLGRLSRQVLNRRAG